MGAGSASKRIPATDPYTENSATANESLGSIRFDTDGRTFRYHQFVSAMTQGELANHSLSIGIASARVTPTFSTSTVKRPAGVVVATAGMTAAYFGWLQIAGPVGVLPSGSTYIRTKGAVAAKDPLCQTVNRKASTMAAGNEHLVFGFARGTDSGSYLASGYLTGCP